MKAVLAVAAALFAAGAEKPLVEGKPDSTVRVVIYEDLQCPDCAAFHEMLDRRLLPRFGAKVAFEHHDFPLAKHKWAREAAIASHYFATIKPELAIEWRRHAMTHQPEITPENFRDKLASWSRGAGASPEKVLAALTDPVLSAAVDASYQEGVARGIARTPTVLVDGEPFIETFAYEEIAQAIEKALDGH